MFDLDIPLIEFSDGENICYFTVRDAVQNVCVLGGTGSGKTTGSGKLLAKKYLQDGFGGAVLTVKNSEKSDWIHYCEACGRLDDLIIVEPGGKHSFNLLEYESSIRVGGHHVTTNIVHVLKAVIQASEAKTSGRSDDAFWEKALDLLIRNVVNLCVLAYGKVTI